MTQKTFAELIDYDAMYTDLARRGMVFSDEDKKKFKGICEAELKDWDGNSIMGSNLAAGASDWLYMFFSLIQNIFNGLDTKNIGDSLASAVDNSHEKGKLHMLNEATIRIYQRFKQEGGVFADAAELVSGQKIAGSVDQSNPEVMENGIFQQIHRQAVNLPEGTPSSLNHRA